MKTHILILAAGVALGAAAEKQPITRYQSIIDRQMFGPLPADFDPTKMPSEVAKGGSAAAAERELTKEQEQLQSAIHFSVINVEKDGKPVVGFTDNSDPKAPKHHYLRVGESQDGWEVKEADPEHATMTIAKNGVEVSLTLGDNSGKGGGKTGRAGAAGGGERTRPGLAGGAGGSLRARREARLQARQEAARKTAAEAAEKEAQRQAQAAEEKAAREAEREAERAQQRLQLQAIQEELRKTREARQQLEAAKKAEEEEKKGDAEDDAQ